MNILINKHNPAIRITAPEFEIDETGRYFIPVKRYCTLDLLPENWTLVEEEPKKVNCPFDKGDCRYCTVQFCGAREELQIKTRSTAEPVDLEKEIERFLNSEESTSHTNAGRYDVAFKDTVKIARHFYELGLNARKDR